VRPAGNTTQAAPVTRRARLVLASAGPVPGLQVAFA